MERPIRSSFAIRGLSRAAAYIWSRMPPSSSYERHTLNPLTAMRAANCCTVWPPRTRVSLAFTPAAASLSRWSAVMIRSTSVPPATCRVPSATSKPDFAIVASPRASTTAV
jgi:hypothetical protein